LLIKSNEQYRGNDQKLLEEDSNVRMVDNALELAARLEWLDPQNLKVSHVLFADEDHLSVSLAALGRALNFAFKMDRG
jgi:hypothetical protein